MSDYARGVIVFWSMVLSILILLAIGYSEGYWP